MLFQSLEFICIFLPVVIAGYFLINRHSTGGGFLCHWWLTGASLFFYGCFHPLFPVLLLVSGALTYEISIRMRKNFDAPGTVIFWRNLGVVLHLGILFLYKYYDFFAGQIGAVTGLKVTALGLLLPIGLSFTTFQQIAFLIDTKRAVLNEEQGLPVTDCTLTEYLTYITFFPKLVQGPITLPAEFLPQLRDETRRRFSPDAFTDGALLFIIGLAKKVLLADTLSGIVRFGYESTYYLDTLSVILLLVSYAFQLYFDFTGYCDMAQGVARMLNFDLPDNFHSPFQARSIKSLWQRWHMSLSRFFTRYVYIPLGGSRKGRARTLVNVMIVFVLSAVWHGAGWTYLAWGVLEGLFVVCETVGESWGTGTMTHFSSSVERTGMPMEKRVIVPVPADSPVKRVTSVLVTNALFCAGLIFFNAQDMTHAFVMIRRLFVPLFPGFLYRIAAQLQFPESYLLQQAVTRLVPQYENLLQLCLWLALLLLSGFIISRKRAAEQIAALKLTKRAALAYAALFAWSLASLSSVGEFLYFAF